MRVFSRFDHQRNLEQTLAAPLKPMPFIVLSSDEPFDLTPFVDAGVLPAGTGRCGTCSVTKFGAGGI